MVLGMFRNALVKIGIIIVNFFNNVARNIKQFLLNLPKPKKEFEANYIRKSFDEIEKLTVSDDWVNIQDDYSRIGKDLIKPNILKHFASK